MGGIALSVCSVLTRRTRKLATLNFGKFNFPRTRVNRGKRLYKQ
jgi:hypothetical protein